MGINHGVSGLRQLCRPVARAYGLNLYALLIHLKADPPLLDGKAKPWSIGTDTSIGMRLRPHRQDVQDPLMHGQSGMDLDPCRPALPLRRKIPPDKA